MSLIALNCPSCGANISLDDDNEFGFCSYCGTKIQNDAIQRLKIEFSGDPISTSTVKNDINTSSVNINGNVSSSDSHDVTNHHTTYNIDNREADKPTISISKPSSGKLVAGIIVLIFGIIFLLHVYTTGGPKGNPVTLVVTIALPLIGLLLIFLYSMSLSLYRKAVKQAIDKNTITNMK